MDDQLDNDLKNRIREVFDNLEGTSADEGWLLLRKKYPEGATRRPLAWLWWSSAAAVLLLFIGIWVFQDNQLVKKPLVVNRKRVPHIVAPKKEEREDKNEVKSRLSTDSALSDSRAEQLVKNKNTHNPGNKNNTTAVLQNDLLTANTHPPVNTLKNDRAEATPTNVAPLASNKEKSAIALQPVAVDKSIPDKLIAASPAKTEGTVIATPKKSNDSKVDSGSSLPTKLIAAIKPQGIDMKNEQPNKVNKSLFSDDNGQPVKIHEKGYRTVSFGVYAGSYFNYAKGSNNQVNIGAGITSDIRLSDRFKLSTGVFIGQNRLGYGGTQQALNFGTITATTTTTSIVTNNGTGSPGISGSSGSSGATAAVGNVSYEPQAFTGTTSASQSSTTSTIINKITTPTIKNSNANLVGLELPVNLKYMLNPKKQNTYVSIGLSSGTFINETYRYGYNYYPSVFSTNVTQSQNQSTHQSFNGFYFARTLNFSFGTGYSIGGSKLIVEPFVKYPLQGLGSQQIKFGASGINLKFNLER